MKIDIPERWTPEQALAVYEFLSELQDVIERTYGDQLHEALRDQCTDVSVSSVRRNVGWEDEAPF